MRKKDRRPRVRYAVRGVGTLIQAAAVAAILTSHAVVEALLPYALVSALGTHEGGWIRLWGIYVKEAKSGD